ncbi:hypothetical protein AKI39_07235 [Bordetella sp. H567]|nr:hypothetical protein AKI39_07235 [Bordetella sp. H567]
MLNAIFAGFRHPVIVKDEQFRFVYLNPPACTMLRRPLAEVIGKTDHDFLPREEADAVVAVDRSVFATGEERVFEETITSPQGSRTLVTHKHCVVLPDVDQLRRFLIAMITDVTQLREAERVLREGEALIRSMFESSPDCVRLLDLTEKPLLMNPAGREIFGLSEDADPGEARWERVVAPEHAPAIQAAFSRARAGKRARFELTITAHDGKVRCMDVIASPVVDKEGKVVRILTIWRDITEAQAARDVTESALRAAEKAADRLASVLESTLDCVWVVDHDWRLTYMNTKARRLLGLGDEAIGQSIWHLYPEEVDGAFAAQYRKAVATRESITFEEYLASLGIWLEVQAAPTEEGLSIFFRDISDRRRAEQERFQAQTQIVHMSRHDALTNLPNRVLTRERLEWALADMKPDTLLAILILDLDGFKSVNDAYGHPVGDLLLRRVADRLRAFAGEAGTLARLGGDEFVLIQPAVAHRDEADRLAEQIIRTLDEPFDLEGLSVTIGASVGIAFAPEGGNTADQLIRAADVALYRAKSGGRSTYRRYVDSMDASVQAGQELKVALKGAIERRELELYFQPQIELASNKVTCCEALIRWRHPVKGMISPAEFIPLAEESGLIIPIGEWVLYTACREAAAWPGDIGVAVNLSSLQFKKGDLVRTVSAALGASGLAASRLQLEITESVMLDESDTNLRILQEIRRLGVTFAMDDFGTGYSSLGYLRTFPFDKIKVDRGFISDLPDGRESLAIVRAVAGIGRSLGITTTVEGVETQAQLDVIHAEGFDEAQGYLFSRPLPASDIVEFLRTAGTR